MPFVKTILKIMKIINMANGYGKKKEKWYEMLFIMKSIYVLFVV